MTDGPLHSAEAGEGALPVHQSTCGGWMSSSRLPSGSRT
jgi:hypothetical protein